MPSIAERRVPAGAQIKHPKRLEAESIGIMREVVAEFRNRAMLYSIGKDSTVMVHLARKAFSPPGGHFRCFTSLSGGSPVKWTQPRAAWGSICRSIGEYARDQPELLGFGSVRAGPSDKAE